MIKFARFHLRVKENVRDFMRSLMSNQERQDMIDWDRVAALREEVGPEDFDEVVEIFLEEVDAEIDALNDGISSEELGEKLHFLKGSALNLGFRDFSGLCQLGEEALKQGESHGVDLGALCSSYAQSRAAFLADLPNRFPA